ncbi:hypothetical protein AB0B30_37545 [Streptomyces narbonensis]|uniref:Uncharacterized protein n=1 Tax=Streptomyces narbonensis TaxID=67333 RepID=A0ABV3CLZ3_9ACTN
MPSMRAVMESRERAALARVKELRAEFEQVRAALADAEEVLNRRVIGLEEYLETLTQRRIMAVFEKAGGDGLWARQVAVGLGWDVSVPARVEGARGRLKRLVERGWLAESRPGMFKLPERDSAVAAGGGWRGGRGGGS